MTTKGRVLNFLEENKTKPKKRKKNSEQTSCNSMILRLYTLVRYSFNLIHTRFFRWLRKFVYKAKK